MKRSGVISFMLVLCLMCCGFLPCAADSDDMAAADSACTLASQYIKTAVPAPQFGSVGGEWSVFALARADEIDSDYADRYYLELEKYVRENSGVITRSKYTEYARTVLALSAIGRDARMVGGYDLLMPLTDYESVIRQGVNGAVFALLALDFYGKPIFDEYENERTLREKYIDYLLEHQHTDGGFGLGDTSDVDVTAMAICALAHYEQSRLAAESAVNYLSHAQETNGLFSSNGETNTESTAQVVSALCAMNIDPTGDERFIKNGVNPLQALLSYQNANGSFSHIGEENIMATEQALCALAAYRRFAYGKSGLYCPYESGIFADTNNHWARESVAAVTAAKIMESDFGMFFNPDRAMKRGEFAKAVVVMKDAAADLTDAAQIKFEDVSEADDFCAHVSAATQRGWIFGIDDTHFAPYESITRAETAVIIYHMQCGANSDLGINTDVISAFDDFTQCPPWSIEALAYCVSNRVLVGSENRLLPDEHITKSQMASILTRIMRR